MNHVFEERVDAEEPARGRSRVVDGVRRFPFWRARVPVDVFGSAAVMLQEMADLQREVAGEIARFNDLLRTDVVAYNRLAADNGAPTLFAGQPIAVPSAAIAHGE